MRAENVPFLDVARDLYQKACLEVAHELVALGSDATHRVVVAVKGLLGVDGIASIVTSIPGSYRVHLARGMAMPWSAVKTTNVLSERPESSNASRMRVTAPSTSRIAPCSAAISSRAAASCGKYGGTNTPPDMSC